MMQIHGKAHVRAPVPHRYPFLAVGWPEIARELEDNPHLVPGSESWSKSEKALRQRVARGSGLCEPHLVFVRQPVWVLPALLWIYDQKEHRFRPKRRRPAVSLVVERVNGELMALHYYTRDDRYCPNQACADPLRILNQAGRLIQYGAASSLKLIDSDDARSRKGGLRIRKKTRLEDKRRREEFGGSDSDAA